MEVKASESKWTGMNRNERKWTEMTNAIEQDWMGVNIYEGRKDERSISIVYLHFTNIFIPKDQRASHHRLSLL